MTYLMRVQLCTKARTFPLNRLLISNDQRGLKSSQVDRSKLLDSYFQTNANEGTYAFSQRTNVQTRNSKV